MFRDSLRFFSLVTLVLLSFAGVWAGLNFYGANRQMPQYQTDLVRQLRAKSPIKVSPLSQPANPDFSPLVHTKFEGGSWVYEQNSQTFPLAEWLQETRADFIFLLVSLDDTANLALLKSTLEQNKIWQKIVFVSRADGVLQDLRALAPQWTFSTGEVFITRLLAFYSIGLVRLIDIPGDLLFLSQAAQLDQKELDALSEIAHQQNKLVLFEQQTPPLSVEKVDILIVQ